MKKTGMVLTAYVCVICGSIFSISYWESRPMEPATHTRPEGYEKPATLDRLSPKVALNLNREGRVTKLEIAPNVPKYFDEKLELVAIAPGSGWLKFTTDDGITPTLAFKNVTQGEIQRFNAFAQSILSPIRVAMARNVLHISAEETVADLAYFKSNGTVLASTERPKAFYYGFNQTDTAPKVVLKKDKQGNVFLVKATDIKEKTAEAIAAKE